MAKIYVSSTNQDLIEYRKEVWRTLDLMQQEVIAMESYAANSERPLKKCLSDVEQCDIYVGIFAFRYGFIPADDNPDGKSITELEYRCAKEKGKECLIFLLDEGTKWPVRHIEMREESLRKLKALRDELKREHTIRWFENERDLADKVSQAIFNKLTRPFKPKQKNLFRLHSKLCNRRRQVSQFRACFDENLEKRPGLPQIYFIHGEDGECHDSLVERLIETHIKGVALAQWGQQESVITGRFVEWVYEGTVEERLRELKMMLFEEFSPMYKKNDSSATALSKLPLALPYRIIVFRHNLSAVKLDEPGWKLIERYISYWAEIEVNLARPHFIICLSVVYPKLQPPVWYKPWTLAKQFDKKIVQRLLEGISTQFNPRLACLMLEELPRVRPEDVKQWFNKYGEQGDFSIKIQQDSLMRLFESEAAQKSMLDVEIELLNLVERTSI